MLAVGFSMLGPAGAQLCAAEGRGQGSGRFLADDRPRQRRHVHVGKVDLGTGTRTALAQIAADELDLPFDRVEMVMGDTATTPDQWLTGANLTIAQGGSRTAAGCATARAALVERAAHRLGVPARSSSSTTAWCA